jgi:superfamily II DNA helicase RecQ
MNMGRIGHTFIDEAHMLISERQYRPGFLCVSLIREYGGPVTLLSASIPPLMMPRLAKLVVLPTTAQYIRRSVAQTNHHYYRGFVEYGQAEGVMESVVLQVTRQLEVDVLGEDGLGIIYCTSTTMVNRLSPFFRFQKVYSGGENNSACIHAWCSQKPQTSRWIVSTTCMIAGVHVDRVAAVVFVNVPYSLINLFQGGVRAGRRQGSVGVSVLLTDEADDREFAGKIGKGVQDAITYYKATQCLQYTMTKYMDGDGQDCATLGAAMCSVCGPEQEWVKGLNACLSREVPSPLHPEDQLEYMDESPPAPLPEDDNPPGRSSASGEC